LATENRQTNLSTDSSNPDPAKGSLPQNGVSGARTKSSEVDEGPNWFVSVDMEDRDYANEFIFK
jgi:hypothetical protein